MFNPVHIVSSNDYNPTLSLHKTEVCIQFKNMSLLQPQLHENNGATKTMFPQEARLRNFTYSSIMLCDIEIKVTRRYGEEMNDVHSHVKTIPRVQIGKIPIMLRSDVCLLNQYSHVDVDTTCECKYDPGGYFIVNGSEKTVLAQERIAENKIYVRKPKNNSKWLYTAEMKSIPDFKIISPKQIMLLIARKNNGFGHPIYVKIQRIKQPIPLFILFRVLGIISDIDIVKYIVLKLDDNSQDMVYSLKASIVNANGYTNNETAFEYFMSQVAYTFGDNATNRKILYTKEIIKTDIFPHCRTESERTYLLGYMTNKLLRCKLGLIKPDDRDSYSNKRIDLVGSLLNNLFRNYMNKVVKDLTKEVIKEINNGSWKSKDDYMNIINNRNIHKFVKSTTIEGGIKRALSTGDFAVKSPNNTKVGVAQVLNRLTYVSSLSH